MTQLHEQPTRSKASDFTGEVETTHDSPRQTRLRAGLGGVACGLVGATFGIGVALNGAQYSTEIAGIPTEITTSISTERAVRISGEVVDSAMPTTDVGGIEFHGVIDLPLSVDVMLRADTELVTALLEGDLASHVHTMRQEVADESEAAIGFFTRRVVTGGLAGAVTAELALAVGSRQMRRRTQPATAEMLSRSARVAGTWLAATALVGGGAASAQGYDWQESYRAFGWSATALGLSSEPPSEQYVDTALEKTLLRFEAMHACPESEALVEQSPHDVTVTTYNIKRGSEQGIEQVAAELEATGSDIITLQEITGPTLAQLAQQLDMDAVHGWTIENGQLTYGNAILSKLPIQKSYSYDLPSQDVEPRQLLVATVELPGGKEAVVATTHLTNGSFGLDGDAREPVRIAQAAEVTRVLRHSFYANKPVILTGDMNSTPDSRTYEMYNEIFTNTAEMGSVAQRATHPRTGRTLDYVYVKPGQAEGAAELLPAEAAVGGSRASDHCSVSTVFTTEQ